MSNNVLNSVKIGSVNTNLRRLLFLLPAVVLTMQLASVYSRLNAQEIDEDRLGIALHRIIQTSPNAFRELIAGGGKDLEGTVTYPCSMSIPGASQTVIRVSDDLRPYVSADLYTGKDKDQGKRIYADVLAKLKRILAKWTPHERQTTNETSVRLSEPDQTFDSAVEVGLRYTSSSVTDRVYVSLTVRSPRTVTPPPSPQTTKSVTWKGGSREEVARAVLKQFLANDFKGINARFNDQLKASLSVQVLEQGWKPLRQASGGFKSQDGPQSRTSRGYDVVAIVCRFENGSIEVEMYFDTTGKIGGLWIQPIPN